MLLGKVINFKFPKFQNSNQIPSYLSESKFEGDQKAQRVPLVLKSQDVEKIQLLSLNLKQTTYFY